MAKGLNKIDVALTALCENAKPYQTLSQKEIADVCGCSRSFIFLIENQAIDKLRRLAVRHPISDYKDHECSIN